jgi:hypothetical protein
MQRTVFQLAVESGAFVEAQRLPSTQRFNHLRECQLVPSHSMTLAADLKKPG